MRMALDSETREVPLIQVLMLLTCGAIGNAFLCNLSDVLVSGRPDDTQFRSRQCR